MTTLQYDADPRTLICKYCAQAIDYEDEWRMFIETSCHEITSVSFIHLNGCVQREEQEAIAAVEKRLQLATHYEIDLDQPLIDFVKQKHKNLEDWAYQYRESNVLFTLCGPKSYILKTPRNSELCVYDQMLNHKDTFKQLLAKVYVYRISVESNQNELNVSSLFSAFSAHLKQCGPKLTYNNYRIWMHVDRFIHELKVDIMLIIHMETSEFDCTPLYNMICQSSEYCWSSFLAPYKGISEAWPEAFNRRKTLLHTDAQAIIDALKQTGINVEIKAIHNVLDLNMAGAEVAYDTNGEMLYFTMNTQRKQNTNINSFYFIPTTIATTTTTTSTHSFLPLKYTSTSSSSASTASLTFTSSIEALPILYDNKTDLEQELQSTRLKQSDTPYIRLIHSYNSTLPNKQKES